MESVGSCLTLTAPPLEPWGGPTLFGEPRRLWLYPQGVGVRRAEGSAGGVCAELRGSLETPVGLGWGSAA